MTIGCLVLNRTSIITPRLREYHVRGARRMQRPVDGKEFWEMLSSEYNTVMALVNILAWVEGEFTRPHP